MALIKMNYFSRTLLRNTDVMVIIPTETPADMERDFDSNFQDQYPVMYLYHGAFGDYTDWIRYTDIESYALKYQIAVVMPSVENSFGLDIENGNSFLTFAGEELPRFVEHIFPVSRTYGKRFVAGLSMGGYVAYSIAVHYPQKFSHAASLSGALDIPTLINMKNSGTAGLPFKFEGLLGADYEEHKEKYDLVGLYCKSKKEGYNLKLYQACGTEDFLYELNQKIKCQLGSECKDFFYEEGTGVHDWKFWNEYMDRAIAWMIQ